MCAEARPAGPPLELGPEPLSQLERRARAAAERAGREGRGVLASATFPVPADLDLSAAVLAARRPGDRFFCLEHPDRDRSAIAALGEAGLVEARGPRRFEEALSACRRAVSGAFVPEPDDDPTAPHGAGPIWVGGFSFADDGGEAPEWASLAPVQLVMPEVALSRRGDKARLSLTVLVRPGDPADGAAERAATRLRDLRAAEMPLLDPDPAVAPRVASAAPPERFLSAVERAVELMAGSELRKVVLAREVRVEAARPFEPAAVFAGLRARFPTCNSYLVGTGELAFVGASPELLVRREGACVQTLALAGTTRSSTDPAVDRNLGERLFRSPKEREEHGIVVEAIRRSLRPVSAWVAAARQPEVIRVQNVQHLATPIRAQLGEPIDCFELAGMLHPTPAVGGEPPARAREVIAALEGLDRGWYAGAVGWRDLAGDGEFCVGIRCALLRGAVAHLYAGNGIVRDSVPAEELAETDAKLGALLPLLA